MIEIEKKKRMKEEGILMEMHKNGKFGKNDKRKRNYFWNAREEAR